MDKNVIIMSNNNNNKDINLNLFGSHMHLINIS